MLSDGKLREIYNEACKPHQTVMAAIHAGLRAVAEAAVKAEREGQEPVAYDTGNELWWAKSPDMNDWIRKNGTPLYVFPPAAPVPEQASKLNLDYLREMARLEARIRELEQASAAVPEGYKDMRKLLAELLGLYDQRVPLRERMELWERCRAMLAAAPAPSQDNGGAA